MEMVIYFTKDELKVEVLTTLLHKQFVYRKVVKNISIVLKYKYQKNWGKVSCITTL